MIIKTKKELSFVLQADQMMNRGFFKRSFLCRLKRLVLPDYVMDFLCEMRKCSFYKHQKGVLNKLLFAIHYFKYRKLGIKLGFFIGYDALGYGTVIPHYGTIVVGGSNTIGKYAVLQTSTCISDNGKKIGDALYLATGVKITSKIVLGDNISIGANSLVNKDCLQNNVLLGGMPAKIIKDEETWYVRDNYFDKVEKVEQLKNKMGL